MPADLTLSQLLLLLQDRGLPCGSGLLELNKSTLGKAPGGLDRREGECSSTDLTRKLY